MKILVVSQSVYPKTGGSSFVTENMVSHLASSNEVKVLGGSDLIWDHLSSEVRNNAEFVFLKSQISLKYRGERFFELFRWILLFPFNLRSAFVCAQKFKPDHIVAIFPDGYFLLLAVVISKLLKVPISSYFHNTYVENRKGLARRVATFIQSTVFERSKYVFTISDGLNDLYKQRYPAIGKFLPLRHTFSHYPKHCAIANSDLNQVHVAFTGNFNQSNLDATVRLVNVLGGMSDVQMHFFTPVPPALLKVRGVRIDLIKSIKYVSADIYFEEISKCDIVILTHGFDGAYDSYEYETIFPTRTIPLLLCGRPIFAHTPPDTFITKFLKQKDCSEVVDVKEEAVIRESFRQLMFNRDRQAVLTKNARLAADEFYAPKVYQKFIDYLQA